jgi:hypothetical protein
MAILDVGSNRVMKRLVIFCLTMIALSCAQDRVSNDLVYEIMDFVIKDQELDKTRGLKLEPEERYSLDKTDEEFLKSLIEPTAPSDTVSDTTKIELLISETFEFGQLSKCLTDADVEHMIRQRESNSDFNWDNSRLGFDLNNKDHWYVMSVPLISKDGSKAVMMIRNLCKGLCGHGWTLLLKKENGAWTSERGISWWH